MALLVEPTTLIAGMRTPTKNGKPTEPAHFWARCIIQAQNASNSRDKRVLVAAKALNQRKIPETRTNMKHCDCPYHRYHVVHVAHGQIYTHSQGDWNAYLRQLDPSEVTTIDSVVYVHGMSAAELLACARDYSFSC